MRRAGSGAIASTSSLPDRRRRPSATARVDARRPRPARTRLRPPRAGGAGPHRPAHYLDLPLPEVAGAPGDPAGDGEIASPPGCRAACARRSTPMPGSGRSSPEGGLGMTRDDDFDGFLSDWLDEQGRARRARLPRRGPGPHDARPASGRGGRASKGGSPCRRPLRLAPVPRLGLVVLIALAIVAAVGIAVLAVGSRHAPLPPPFGPARNGAIVYGGGPTTSTPWIR